MTGPASPRPEILVVGAGPTGLVSALWLARSGTAVRIVDRSAGPGEASRAMAVQARTLEFHRQLGFADEAVARGLRMERTRVRVDGRVAVRLELGEIGGGLSPFPFVLSLPQDEHERLLLDKLQTAGVQVEWNTELREFREEGGRVHTLLRTAAGADEAADFAYLCGCDGAHSTVRHALGLGFPGGTYEQRFFVADVSGTLPDDEGGVDAFVGADAFCLAFPIRTSGMVRLIGIVPQEAAGRATLTFDDIRPTVERLSGVKVRQVNWFSTYHVHHRVADRFRVGRAFIAGDAGHVHSPAGGQGMNTGIGDAVNLAWKLAAVVSGRASPELLDTYEPERIGFARSLVQTTDRVFALMIGRDLAGRAFRGVMVPYVMPAATVWRRRGG